MCSSPGSFRVFRRPFFLDGLAHGGGDLAREDLDLADVVVNALLSMMLPPSRSAARVNSLWDMPIISASAFGLSGWDGVSVLGLGRFFGFSSQLE